MCRHVEVRGQCRVFLSQSPPYRFLDLFLFMSMCVSEYMYATYGARRGHWVPQSRSYLTGVLGTQLSPLEKQQMLLTVEPYLQPLYLGF